MAEYIEREAFKEKLDEIARLYISEKTFQGNFAAGVVCYIRDCIIDEISAADVAPVVHGRWVKRGCKWQCTHCKVLMSIDGTPKENLLNYCPNCGAKMDG